MPSPARRFLPEPALQAYRAARRVALRTQERMFPPDLVHPPRPVLDLSTPVRLMVGPANFAGQGWEWARAAERCLSGVRATAMSIERDALMFPADYVVPVKVFRSLRWQDEQRETLRSSYTHVLVEALRPMLGNRYGNDCRRDLPRLRRDGLRVGLVAHGSDIRLGTLHRELYPHSPWNDGHWDHGRRLQAQAERLSAIFNGYDGPRFVSTPDLLDFAPGAVWLPTVLDAAVWATDTPVLERARPVVLHVPSNPHMKGSHLADPVLQDLHERGLIDYRRLHGIAPQDMPAQVAAADIVLDQLVIGSYGVMAQQAMAAGRVVLAHVHERVRERLPLPVPIVEVTPDTLGPVLEGLLTDREPALATAVQGPAFVAHVHDGRLAAQALAPFLGTPTPA